MSVWGDIRKRSSGEVIRREDIQTDPLEELSNPITFVGNIDKSGIPNLPAAGQVYITNDKVTINGVEYPSGCALLYDGNNWHNIGYYQPKLDNKISDIWEI